MVYFGLVSLYSSQIFNCGSITKSGKPQAVIVWVIELIYLVILIWIRPFMDKRTNAFNITIGVINFINALFSCFLKCFQTTKCRVISYGGGVFHMNAVFALFYYYSPLLHVFLHCCTRTQIQIPTNER